MSLNKKNIINTENAPAAIGTYSQGMIYENLIFTLDKFLLIQKQMKLSLINLKNKLSRCYLI